MQDEILQQFQIRKSNKEKDRFIDYLSARLTKAGYTEEDIQLQTKGKGLFRTQNIIVGNPDEAKIVIGAHYDTCARMPIPNLITPCSFLLFLGYQILVSLVLLLPPLIPALLAGVLLDSNDTVFYVWYVFFWVNFILLLFGPANKHNANDNTSGVITLLEIARTLPENQRNKVCFVLFDLEEAGLIGSASYRKAHKNASNQQVVLNLDCVGDGDAIMMFPTKKLKKDRKKLTALYKSCGYFGNKSLTVHEKGFSVYPSDQANFPYGVGICALRRKKNILYMSRIHTPKDTILEETNVNILRAALTTYICCDAAQ